MTNNANIAGPEFDRLRNALASVGSDITLFKMEEIIAIIKEDFLKNEFIDLQIINEAYKLIGLPTLDPKVTEGIYNIRLFFEKKNKNSAK